MPPHRLCLVVLSLLFLPASPVGAAVDSLHSGLRPWDPSLSWPGHTQYDARLDKTVHFWRAGVSLARVFEDVARQTGVALTFYPADDENQRVRVNLFLNDESPPALRDLMAQLMWVTDCRFFWRESQGLKVYHLMGTSIGRAAADRLRERRERALRDWRARTDVKRGEMAARLDEYRDALQLPRDDLIAAYRGVDDALLLAMLHPARRAGAQFVCRHLEEIPKLGEPMRPGVRTHYRRVRQESLTAEDRVALTAALGTAEGGSDCHIRVTSDGVIELTLAFAGGASAETCPVVDLGDPARRAAEDRVALRRLLGETISEAEEAVCVEEYEKKLAGEQIAREREARDAARPLSATAAARLSSVALPALPFTDGDGWGPWVTQEAVARSSGFHVVSDCFWWQPSSEPAPWALLDDDGTRMHALGALDTMCQAASLGDPGVSAWEWGNAGSFLRFRSADRDIWRGSILPQEVLDAVDALIAPYLPQDLAQAAQAGQLDLSLMVSLKAWAAIAGQLTDLQMAHGPHQNYGDPGDIVNIARHAVLPEILATASHHAELTRILATLSTPQWDQLCGDCLDLVQILPSDRLAALYSESFRRPDGAGPPVLASFLVAIRPEYPSGHPSRTRWSSIRSRPERRPGCRPEDFLSDYYAIEGIGFDEAGRICLRWSPRYLPRKVSARLSIRQSRPSDSMSGVAVSSN